MHRMTQHDTSDTARLTLTDTVDSRLTWTTSYAYPMPAFGICHCVILSLLLLSWLGQDQAETDLDRQGRALLRTESGHAYYCRLPAQPLAPVAARVC